MKRELFEQALDKIPDIIAKLCAFEGLTSKYIIEHVRKYTPYGSLCEKSDFVIDEYEMQRHIEKAMKMPGFSVENNGEAITVTRLMKDKSKYIVTYRLAEL